MNQVVRRPYLSNILRRRGLPISPAKRPRVMSQGESSPPYDPNQPATASTSMPMQHMISFFATGLPSTLSYVAPTHRRRRAFKIHDRFIARACTVNSCRSLLSERILALDLVANELEEVTPAHAHLHTVWCAGCERPLAGASISYHKHPAITERAIGVAGEEPRVPLADSLTTLIVAPLQLRPERRLITAIIRHVGHQQVRVVTIPRLTKFCQSLGRHHRSGIDVGRFRHYRPPVAALPGVHADERR